MTTTTALVPNQPRSTTRRRRNSPGIYPVLLILLVLVAAPLASVLVTAVTGYREEPSALHTLVEPGMLEDLGNTVVL